MTIGGRCSSCEEVLDLVNGFGKLRYLACCNHYACSQCLMKSHECPYCSETLPTSDATLLNSCRADAVENGWAGAQFLLGQLYYTGQGITQSFSEAARLMRLAADSDHTAAQFNTAMNFFLGEGVEKDYTKSAHYFSSATASGCHAAEYQLGLQYARGYGVEVNNTEAVRLFKLAGLAGDNDAATKLAQYYCGVIEGAEELIDYNEGIRLLEHIQEIDSDETNRNEANAICAILRWNGHGVEKNKQLSLDLAMAAAEKGNPRAHEFLQSLRRYCSHCGKDSEGKMCTRCKTVSYCCIECQGSDWQIWHKDWCKPYTERVHEHAELIEYESQITLCKKALSSGEVDQALDILADLVDKYPDMPDSYGLLGSIYMMRGDYDLAEESLSVALEIAYDSPEATQGGQKPVIINWQNMMGAVLKELGRFSDAAEYFKKSLALGDSQARRYLADLRECEQAFGDEAGGDDNQIELDDNEEGEEEQGGDAYDQNDDDDDNDSNHYYDHIDSVGSSNFRSFGGRCAEVTEECRVEELLDDVDGDVIGRSSSIHR